MKTKGMSSPALSEDDVRRILSTLIIDLIIGIGRYPWADRYALSDILFEAAKLQITGTEPPANQAQELRWLAEDNAPPWVERRKRPEPKGYK